MNNPETPFYVGYVEQGITGGQDPLSPPISISRNGTLAKWRDKFNLLDLRVNDPGLEKYGSDYEQVLMKTQGLGIETVVTLPEYFATHYDLPPAPPQPEGPVKKVSAKRADSLVYFKPCYLSLPSAIPNKNDYQLLTVDECKPIIELASRHGVTNVIVPVSEPGLFLDPMAEESFKKALGELVPFAKSLGIKLHLRNGGLSVPGFKKIRKDFDVGYVLNVGIAHLEGEYCLDLYQKVSEFTSIIILQQMLPGLDKWEARKFAMRKGIKEYIDASNEFNAVPENEEGTEYHSNCLKRFFDARRNYHEACKNHHLNLGLFQNGDLNLVPLIKAIRKDLDAGLEKSLIIETVPNTRNTDFILRYLLPDGFPGAF